MALVSVYKAITVTTPAAVQIIKIASVPSPSLVLAVRVITTQAVTNGNDSMCAQVGVCTPDGLEFGGNINYVIPNSAIRSTSPRIALATPDFVDPDGNIYGKGVWWAIRYLPGTYVGAIQWKAKIYIDVLK